MINYVSMREKYAIMQGNYVWHASHQSLDIYKFTCHANIWNHTVMQDTVNMHATQLCQHVISLCRLTIYLCRHATCLCWHAIYLYLYGHATYLACWHKKVTCCILTSNKSHFNIIMSHASYIFDDSDSDSGVRFLIKIANLHLNIIILQVGINKSHISINIMHVQVDI